MYYPSMTNWIIHVEDILNVALDLGRLKIYVLLVYLDVKDKERNKYIYENLDLMMRDLDNQMPVL